MLIAAVEKRPARRNGRAASPEINEDKKSGSVDLGRGESFGFLGFDFRRVRSLREHGAPTTLPKLKKRTALPRKLERCVPPSTLTTG